MTLLKSNFLILSQYLTVNQSIYFIFKYTTRGHAVVATSVAVKQRIGDRKL